MGAVPGAVPPLDLSAPPASAGASPAVRGISADFAREIAQSLGLALRWRVYPDRPAMIAALARGEIDAATTATGEDPGPPLLLAAPTYQPSRSMSSRANSARRRAASRMSRRRRRPSGCASAYPQLRPVGYRTATGALLAVTLGDADAFVGDYVTTTYAIDHFDFTASRSPASRPSTRPATASRSPPRGRTRRRARERVDAALAALPPRFLLESMRAGARRGPRSVSTNRSCSPTPSARGSRRTRSCPIRCSARRAARHFATRTAARPVSPAICSRRSRA